MTFAVFSVAIILPAIPSVCLSVRLMPLVTSVKIQVLKQSNIFRPTSNISLPVLWNAFKIQTAVVIEYMTKTHAGRYANVHILWPYIVSFVFPFVSNWSLSERQVYYYATEPKRWSKRTLVFTARCYAPRTSHGPVSVSVCLSQAGVLLKRQSVGSHKQHHTIHQGL